METFTISYSIHNKGYMMDEIINGLVYSLNESKYNIKYKFIFDGCTDNTKEEFEKERVKLKNTEYIETNNLFELKTNNILMKNFDTDFLIIFQDDMVLRDINFLNNILKIYKIYGDKLGLIGCRDGFDEGLSNMYSSAFSVTPSRIVLNSGEYREKMMLNRGPLVFTKKLVEIMGYFDEIYGTGIYEEVEYSLKCTLKGLITIVMGVDLIHNKFDHKNKKKVQHTAKHILAKMYKINIKIFRQRWYGIAKM